MFASSTENLRCCLYIRVSTAKQAETGYGEELQETACTTAAQIRKWKVVHIYKDSAYSGTLDENDRPALKEMLNDAREKKFDMVILFAIDRLARDLRITLDLINQLKKSGVGIVSTRENIDTSTPAGEFTLQIFAGVAQLERSTIIERMKKGKDELRKKKGWTGGVLPYGYKMIDNVITINKDESPQIEFIFYKKKEGFTPGKIADDLNKLNIPSRLGGKWSKETVKKIIKREDVYLGGIIKENLNGIRWPKII